MKGAGVLRSRNPVIESLRQADKWESIGRWLKFTQARS
jgi:hypothetical protein